MGKILITKLTLPYLMEVVRSYNLLLHGIIFICCSYAYRPEQWKSRQEAKQSTYNEFCSAFGSSKSNFPKNTFVSDACEDASEDLEVKNTRKESDNRPTTSGVKRHREEHARDTNVSSAGGKGTKQKKSKTSEATDKPATKKKPFLSGEMIGKNRHSNKFRF